MNEKQAYYCAQHRLNPLAALKDQIRCNFPGSTEKERDAILDIIAQVCDREEKFKRHCKEQWQVEI